MRVLTLILGEAAYDTDALGYIPNSIRSFVSYSAANGYHSLDDYN
jgi:hypothetical protein